MLLGPSKISCTSPIKIGPSESDRSMPQCESVSVVSTSWRPEAAGLSTHVQIARVGPHTFEAEMRLYFEMDASLLDAVREGMEGLSIQC